MHRLAFQQDELLKSLAAFKRGFIVRTEHSYSEDVSSFLPFYNNPTKSDVAQETELFMFALLNVT